MQEKLKNIKIGDYYNLNANQKIILSKKEENGYEHQYFDKEEIKWVVLDKKVNKNGEVEEILLISEKPTEQEVTLQGQARI